LVRAITTNISPAPQGPHRCQIRPQSHDVGNLRALDLPGSVPADPAARKYSYQIGETRVMLARGVLFNQLVNCLATWGYEGRVYEGNGIFSAPAPGLNLYEEPRLLVEEFNSFEEIQPNIRVPAGQAISVQGHELSRGIYHRRVVHTASPNTEVQEQLTHLLNQISESVFISNWRAGNVITRVIEQQRINQLITEAEDLGTPQTFYNSIFNSLVEAHEHGETSIAIDANTTINVRSLNIDTDTSNASEVTRWYDRYFCISVNKAAQVMSKAVRDFCQDHPNSSLKDIRFMFDDASHFAVYHHLFAQMQDREIPRLTAIS
jgi:hypothetical protein